jgi:hypothetical protein
MGFRGVTGSGASSGPWFPGDPNLTRGPELRGVGAGAAERGSATVGTDEERMAVSVRRRRDRLGWAHWLDGVAVLPFAAYFSVAPAVYPPLADSVNELAAFRGSRGTHIIWRYEHAP